MNEKAETIKIRYQYRRLILTGKLKISRKTAIKLIGPDTAYHLYSQAPTPLQVQSAEREAQSVKGKRRSNQHALRPALRATRLTHTSTPSLDP